MTTGGIVALAAAISIIPCAVIGLGIALATGRAVESVARQPEAAGKIQTVTLLGAALAEATAIYAFVVALILLLVYKV